MKTIFERWKYFFGLDDDEDSGNSSDDNDFIPSTIINGTTEYWIYKNNRYLKVGYLVVNKTTEVGQFVCINKKGDTIYQLIPFKDIYEKSNYVVMENRDCKIHV